MAGQTNWLSTIGSLLGGLTFGPVAAGLGSFAGGMLEGDEFGEAMAGGLMSFGLGSMFNAAGDMSGITHSAAGGATSATQQAPTGFMDSMFDAPNFGETWGNIQQKAAIAPGEGGGWWNIGKDALTKNPLGSVAALGGAAMGGGGLTEQPKFEPPMRKRGPLTPEQFPDPRVRRPLPANPARYGYGPEHRYWAEGGPVQKFATGGPLQASIGDAIENIGPDIGNDVMRLPPRLPESSGKGSRGSIGVLGSLEQLSSGIDELGKPMEAALASATDASAQAQDAGRAIRGAQSSIGYGLKGRLSNSGMFNGLGGLFRGPRPMAGGQVPFDVQQIQTHFAEGGTVPSRKEIAEREGYVVLDNGQLLDTNIGRIGTRAFKGSPLSYVSDKNLPMSTRAAAGIAGLAPFAFGPLGAVSAIGSVLSGLGFAHDLSSPGGHRSGTGQYYGGTLGGQMDKGGGSWYQNQPLGVYNALATAPSTEGFATQFGPMSRDSLRDFVGHGIGVGGYAGHKEGGAQDDGDANDKTLTGQELAQIGRGLQMAYNTAEEHGAKPFDTQHGQDLAKEAINNPAISSIDLFSPSFSTPPSASGATTPSDISVDTSAVDMSSASDMIADAWSGETAGTAWFAEGGSVGSKDSEDQEKTPGAYLSDVVSPAASVASTFVKGMPLGMGSAFGAVGGGLQATELQNALAAQGITNTYGLNNISGPRAVAHGATNIFGWSPLPSSIAKSSRDQYNEIKENAQKNLERSERERESIALAGGKGSQDQEKTPGKVISDIVAPAVSAIGMPLGVRSALGALSDGAMQSSPQTPTDILSKGGTLPVTSAPLAPPGGDSSIADMSFSDMIADAADAWSGETAGTAFYAEGGPIEHSQSQEPSPIVTNAVAAIRGQHPEPQLAIQAFIQVYGPEKYAMLREQVINADNADQRQGSGLGAIENIGGAIQGPGTGTSDSIPGQIVQDGQPVEEIRVSDGEYILPKAMVDAAGGEEKLDQIRHQVTGKVPA